MAKSERIVIYGAGGHGAVVAEIAGAMGYREILFVDDGVNEYPDFEAFFAREGADEWEFALGVGENRIRERIYERILGAGGRIATLVHPASVVSESAFLGRGTVVMPAAVVNARARIGEGCIVNTASVVEHDCVLESFAHLSPNATLGGGVSIGKRSHIGIGSSLIPGVKVGADCVVGAGSVVVESIPAGWRVAGVPTRRIGQEKHHG
ncbi:acetyltransferase [Nitratifractor sp.]